MRMDASHFLKKHAAWTVANLGFGYMDYRGRIEEGQSPARAAVGALATAAFFEMFPGVGAAWMVGSLIAAGVPAYTQWQKSRDAQWRQLHRPNMGGQFRDNQQAMTLRQRAAQQIHEHHALVRSVLGREARFMK